MPKALRRMAEQRGVADVSPFAAIMWFNAIIFMGMPVLGESQLRSAVAHAHGRNDRHHDVRATSAIRKHFEKQNKSV